MTAWPYPRWIAHRGAGKLAPDNTLAAFRVGASHGYRAFECDVKLSADGVPFLLHDATLQRTTPEHGMAGAFQVRAQLAGEGRLHHHPVQHDFLLRVHHHRAADEHRRVVVLDGLEDGAALGPVPPGGEAHE